MSGVPHRRFVVYEDLGDGAERHVRRVSLYEKADPRTGLPVVKARLESRGDRGWNGEPSAYVTLAGERLSPEGLSEADVAVLGKALCVGFLMGETKRRRKQHSRPVRPKLGLNERIPMRHYEPTVVPYDPDDYLDGD